MHGCIMQKGCNRVSGGSPLRPGQPVNEIMLKGRWQLLVGGSD